MVCAFIDFSADNGKIDEIKNELLSGPFKIVSATVRGSSRLTSHPCPLIVVLLALLTLAASITQANETDGDPERDTETIVLYTDQYLDEFDADEKPIDIVDEYEGLPRSFSANYRTYVDARELIRPLVEHGLEFLWYQETDGYGSFNATFEQLFNNDGRPNRDSQGERFQLENRDFVINENYAADTRLGHFRSISDRLLATSYRFFLPTTLLQGGTARIHSDRAELNLSAGYIGGLQGTAARGFRKTQGTLLGASGQFAIDDNWSASAQFWDTNDAGTAGRNHQVGGGAVQYLSDDLTQRHQLRSLKDSKGHFGSWYDGVSILGRWRHRYGAFHFERGLRWTDVQIDNDRQGLFWRGDFSSFRWRWTMGSEVSRNNLDEQATIAGNVVTNSFVNRQLAVSPENANRRLGYRAYATCGFRYRTGRRPYR